MYQPPIELALGTPLQVKEMDDEVIVEIRQPSGDKAELKRFSDDN